MIEMIETINRFPYPFQKRGIPRSRPPNIRLNMLSLMPTVLPLLLL